MPASVANKIGAMITRHGPIAFDQFMDLALYDPEHGYYATTGRAGRRGDFLTSPEVGPLFGAVIANVIDSVWEVVGRPSVFTVVECGAGTGTLARSVLNAQPRCAAALRYLLVERSAEQRRRHRDHLALELPSLAFPSAHENAELPDALGPIVVSLAEMPPAKIVGVILANELLDNLPFAVLERTDRWSEVRIALERGQATEVLVDAPAAYVELADALAPDATRGSRIPVQLGIWRWLTDALGLIEQGELICFDYARTTAEMANAGDWLRTFRGHQHGGNPLQSVGEQDITSDVALDQFMKVRRPVAVDSQVAFLRRHGIEALVEEGKRVWGARAHLGDVVALTARSRVAEAEALLDPDGLGGFCVMRWRVR